MITFRVCGACGTRYQYDGWQSCPRCRPRDEHYGLTAMGLWLHCIQDVHFCWGSEDDWTLERERIGSR